MLYRVCDIQIQQTYEEEPQTLDEKYSVFFNAAS